MKNNSFRTIVITVIVVLALLAIFKKLNNQNQQNFNSNNNSTVSYQQQVMSVEQMEKQNPAKFLFASGTYKSNFWGNAMNVHGTLTNNATVANYKDAVIQVVFYSHTQTELQRQNYTIFDYFPSHTTKNFELKVNRPAACEKLGLVAISATPY